MLHALVNTAAKVGAQQFIEMIFTSSAGKVVFAAYKDSSTLPEVIARDHGNEKIANYLEDITKRYFFLDNGVRLKTITLKIGLQAICNIHDVN